MQTVKLMMQGAYSGTPAHLAADKVMLKYAHALGLELSHRIWLSW